jgi:hypothetical protein
VGILPPMSVRGGSSSRFAEGTDQPGRGARNKTERTRRTRITGSAQRTVETMICAWALRVLEQRRGIEKPNVGDHE